MQRLFNVAKIGVFLDGYSPGTEKRREEDVKVITLNLRVQPFDVKHAIAIDDGLANGNNVRGALFNLSNDEPKAHIERVALNMGCPPQTLRIYEAPDAEEARLALLQAKISGAYARRQKDVNGWAFCFKATVGPLGRDELESVHHWYLSQKFVEFVEAEPSMDMDVPPVSSQVAPTWDDGEAVIDNAAPVESEHAREVGSRGTARRKRTKPETAEAVN